MSAVQQIADARATSQVLRATAKALRSERGSLRCQLLRAAEAIDNVSLLAVRFLKRIEQLEQQLKGSGKDGAP